jgi:glycosyltransferase involved in cell wall biosynthesis
MSDGKKMRLLVDGVFFQLNNTGIARVWQSLLPLVAQHGDIELFMLDRGNAPDIAGVTRLPFPSRKLAEQSADDSILIQRMCDHLEIDIFTSTYYTSPLATPMLLMVYDMIPELFGFDLTQRAWQDKELAISFSQRQLCISANTREDLLSFYPELDSERVVVAHCGVDGSVFRPAEKNQVEAFYLRHGIDRPYFLFVGSRVQHNGYKNSKLFFDALSGIEAADFDVVCVGGEREIEAEVLGRLPEGVRCHRFELSDADLSLAYSGALALVYPSLYEGFGMPVIEAMASGCPVITTAHGSLLEAAGDAACIISGTSVEEMRGALKRIRDKSYREELRRLGLVQSSRFCWQDMADALVREAWTLHEQAENGEFGTFFAGWRRLREIQASVDY